jgi:hypothetical protein
MRIGTGIGTRRIDDDFGISKGERLSKLPKPPKLA